MMSENPYEAPQTKSDEKPADEREAAASRESRSRADRIQIGLGFAACLYFSGLGVMLCSGGKYMAGGLILGIAAWMFACTVVVSRRDSHKKKSNAP